MRVGRTIFGQRVCRVLLQDDVLAFDLAVHTDPHKTPTSLDPQAHYRQHALPPRTTPPPPSTPSRALKQPSSSPPLLTLAAHKSIPRTHPSTPPTSPGQTAPAEGSPPLQIRKIPLYTPQNCRETAAKAPPSAGAPKRGPFKGPSAPARAILIHLTVCSNFSGDFRTSNRRNYRNIFEIHMQFE